MAPTEANSANLAVIDGQPINVATQKALVHRCAERLRAGLGFTLYTLNLDHVVKRRSDKTFSDAYSRATFVTADGWPIVWLAARQGARLDRVTGADIVIPMCRMAARNGLPVAFFGSTQQSLAGAAQTLKRMFPRLKIAHMEAPPAGFDPARADMADIARRIADSGARICFVALGAPKQELFSDRAARTHDNIGYLGIGAALDFISGEQQRAPALFRDHGLEWFWRLATNPRRLFVRYARCAGTLAALAFARATSDVADQTRVAQ